MNEKEVAELRRRFKADRSNITHVRGCYVNDKREIISEFDQPISMLSQDEGEGLLGILRKTLSGTLGKQLLDIRFDTRQVAEGEEHGLLMKLRDSQLKDEEAVQPFFQRAIGSLELEGNYMILLACDAYDVPYRSKDGERQEDASEEVYRYILCSVCPVKQTKPALTYSAHENLFHHLAVDWVVSAPATGFLFPAFDDRGTNLYDARLYTKDIADTRSAFVDAVFRQTPPMAAAVQMETFQSVMGETLEEDCSYQVVETVNDQLRDMIAEHKLNKEEEPLTVSQGVVTSVLRSSGVEEERVERFAARYDEAFGPGAELSPRNLVDTRQLEIKTPDVTIRVDPLKSELVETKVIGGIPYILIRADDGVEVDGVPVTIA